MRPLLLFLLFLLFQPLEASPLFFEVAGAAAEGGMPNPLHLAPDWWNYFEQNQEVLGKRIDQFSAYLEESNRGLSDGKKSGREIEKILLHLKLYQKLKALRVVEPPSGQLKESYTFDQVAGIVEKIYSIEEVKKSEEGETAFHKRRMEAIEERMDKKILFYQKTPLASRERFLTGLQIIAMRSAYAVNGEKLRLSNERVANLALTAASWIQEKNYSFNHLRVDEAFLSESKKLIEEAEENYSEAKEKSLEVELAYTRSIQGKEWQGDAAYRQESINAYLNEAISYTKLSLLRAKVYLYRLLSGYGGVDLKRAEGSVEEWRAAISTIEDYISIWEVAVQNELAATGERYSSSDRGEIATIRQQLKSLQLSIERMNVLHISLLQLEALLQLLDGEISKNLHPFQSLFVEVTRGIYACCIPSESLLTMTLFKIGDLPITLSNLLQSILSFIATLLLSKFLRFALKKALSRKRVVSTASMFILDRLIHYLFIFGGTVISLTIIGLDFSNVLLLVGALSVGIGFGLQSIVNNFVSSLILLFSRSVKLGDLIQLPSGEWGRVVDVNIQNTIITTSDGVEIVEPNSNLIASKFVNWTMNNPYRRIHIPFYVDYDTDKELLKTIVIDCANKISHTVLDDISIPRPALWLVGLEQGYMKYELVVWISSKKSPGNQGVIADYYWEIEKTLKSHQISVPLPKRDLYIKDLQGGKRGNHRSGSIEG